MDPNPLATGCPGLMNLSDEQRSILAAYRKLNRKPARVVGELDPTHHAAADSDEDVNREGDV